MINYIFKRATWTQKCMQSNSGCFKIQCLNPLPHFSLRASLRIPVKLYFNCVQYSISVLSQNKSQGNAILLPIAPLSTKKNEKSVAH